MPEQQAGFSHWEVTFDEKGGLVQLSDGDKLVSEVAREGLSDIFVFAHGWNNDPQTARNLYLRFYTQMQEVLAGYPRTSARIGTVGVIWPSMRWIDESPPDRRQGAAGMDHIKLAVSDRQLVQGLRAVFTDFAQQNAIDGMARLLDGKAKDEQSLREFHGLIGQLAGAPDPTGSVEDNGESRGLLGEDALDVFQRFAALAPRRRVGGAAGIEDSFGKLWGGAKEALRAATYWEMKKRAGVVGKKGLGPLMGRLQRASAKLRVHLIGHSFGARLVSFCLAGLPNDPTSRGVASVMLLQGAFSHFAFAAKLPQDPDRGGALKGMAARVDGPICVTHSLKDTAVGTAYPLASLASRDDAAALGDPLYRWGAMGHDGAQAVAAASAPLGKVGAKYPFGVGSFLNLDANHVITHGGPPSGAHSDIVHPQIAWALLGSARVVH